MLLAIIDTGASANYISTSAAESFAPTPVRGMKVETAGGHVTGISHQVSLVGAVGGLEHMLTAYVFDMKFDLILGRTWIKRFQPFSSAWDKDKWAIDHQGIRYDLIPESTREMTDGLESHAPSETAFLISQRALSRIEKRDEVDQLYIAYAVETEGPKMYQEDSSTTALLSEFLRFSRASFQDYHHRGRLSTPLTQATVLSSVGRRSR